MVSGGLDQPFVSKHHPGAVITVSIAPEVLGSQDAIGIIMPGLNRAYYEGDYWSARIDMVHDELTLQFIEQALYLVPLGPTAPRTTC